LQYYTFNNFFLNALTTSHLAISGH